jgi:hypothetical protein
MTQGNHVQVDGVKHQLNGEEHHDDVSPGQKATHTNGKKNSRKAHIPA